MGGEKFSINQTVTKEVDGLTVWMKVVRLIHCNNGVFYECKQRNGIKDIYHFSEIDSVL